MRHTPEEVRGNLGRDRKSSRRRDSEERDGLQEIGQVAEGVG